MTVVARLCRCGAGVKVSIIEPGFFNTPIVQRAADNLDKVYRALPDVRWLVSIPGPG